MSINTKNYFISILNVLDQKTTQKMDKKRVGKKLQNESTCSSAQKCKFMQEKWYIPFEKCIVLGIVRKSRVNYTNLYR